MLLISYIIIAIIVFWIVEFLSINIGSWLGAGPGDIGIVVSAISILCTIVVICTIVIVDTIKNYHEKK